MTEDHSDKVRTRAYQIWQAAGEPQGCEAAHWEQAERELAAESAEQPVQPLTAAELEEPNDAPDPVTDGTPARPAAPGNAA